MLGSRNHVFYHAIAVSLALHAMLLFALPNVTDTAHRAASLPSLLVAHLRDAPAPVTRPPAEPIPERKASQVPRPAPKAPKLPVVVEAPAPAAETPVPADPADPVPPVAAETPGVPEAPVVTEALVPAAPAIEAQPDSLSRDQYRLQLTAEAMRYAKSRYPPRGYPPLARENNWQGNVRVAVEVGADGRASVSLTTGSGYEVLDRQALEMFRQAARSVPVPAALRGKEFTLSVRAAYALED